MSGQNVDVENVLSDRFPVSGHLIVHVPLLHRYLARRSTQ